MPRKQQLAVAHTLGERVRCVHDTPIRPGLGWPPVDAWPRLVATRLAEAPAALRAMLPERVASEAEALLPETDWFAGESRLLHADLTQDHALVSRQGDEWRLTGLIDGARGGGRPDLRMGGALLRLLWARRGALARLSDRL